MLYSGTTEANSSLLYIHWIHCPLYKKASDRVLFALLLVWDMFLNTVTTQAQCLKWQIKHSELFKTDANLDSSCFLSHCNEDWLCWLPNSAETWLNNKAVAGGCPLTHSVDPSIPLKSVSVEESSRARQFPRYYTRTDQPFFAPKFSSSRWWHEATWSHKPTSYCHHTLTSCYR